MTELTVRETAAAVLVPDPDKVDKHARSRLGAFATWLDTAGVPWYVPDLVAYRDHMLGSGYAPSTVSAHLSTVRARYGVLVRDRVRFFALVPDEVVDGVEFGSKKEAVDELVTRIQNAVDPAASPVKLVTRQDRPDAEFLRLTSEQASALLAAPGVRTLAGLRDTAVIGLLLCTGIREAELSALEVDDLRQTYGGELALHVREGKGSKERMVLYGELSWVLAIVDKWLEKAGIKDGPVFKGLYKGGQKLRPGKLSVRAVEYILESYPIMVDGQVRSVKPHDCRRTYAKRMFMAGMSLLAIQQNLGHADHKTTQRYIGPLDPSERRPPSVYAFDLAALVNGNGGK